MLRSWKLYAIGGLAVVLMGAVWQWRSEIETRVRYAVQGEQIEQALHDTRQRLTEARLERERHEALAKARGRDLEALRARERAQERSLRELMDNEEVRKWGESDIPPAVAERLRSIRQGTEDDHGHRD